MPFVVGQRVRVSRYEPSWRDPSWGDPHFIVGHFGHIESFYGSWIEVRISHAPGGGPVVDPRVLEPGDEESDAGIWPMEIGELEAVD